ncbi:unnamed protein product [Toxocara canis]|uniref:Calponin-homology (CH) domain-containing protein n=1 Tax=Toxocara canis TaxID=6265 RepID=A0A183TVD4_TOXCA|nr:unnamed protein product [Toxocara canis]
MGGVVSSSLSKLLRRRQLGESIKSKWTVVFRKEVADNKSKCDQRSKFHQTREECDSASVKLEVKERELVELSEALDVSRRGSNVRSALSTSYIEKVESLTAELEESRKREIQLRAQVDRLSDLLKRKVLVEDNSTEAKQNDENKENREIQKLKEENERLRAIIGELNGEKGTLGEALRDTKEESDRLMQEIIQLKSTIEVEREEWNHLQADLLIAVRVANDFKIEAQEKMMSLYARIADLQRRRQSSVTDISVGNMKLFDDQQQSWEDVAWQRLMSGCERSSRRDALLRWCQQAISAHPNLELTNFSSSWTDGKALCYLLANFYPEKINADSVSSLSAEECIKLALDVGMHIGIEVQLSVDEILCSESLDWTLMKYILYIYYLVSVQG